MRRRAIARTAVVGGAAYAAGKHAAGQAPPEQQYEEPAEQPQEAAGDPLEQLKQLNELREQGILTEEEFTAEKRKLLGQ
jgi:hypothetical protein